ncbi:hypothetical protein EC01288_0947 [Escherichia coli 0.1288]|nr:hypothetical protein EC01288_0947 [Escherichia coli 0.1288]
MFWRQRNPFVLCNHHSQRLTPLAAFFEIAFGIRFYLFTFEDQHNYYYLNQTGGSVTKNKAPHKARL